VWPWRGARAGLARGAPVPLSRRAPAPASGEEHLGLDLPPEVEDICRNVTRWARALPPELFTTAAEQGVFPAEAVLALLHLGVQRAALPVRSGGLGLGAVGGGAALSRLAAVECSLAAVVMASASCAALLHLGGTPSQKRRWLRPLLRGEGLGAIALTEPDGGSDLAAVRTRAEAAPDGWHLFGHKTFITNAAGPLLHVVVTLARVDGAGPCCFAVPAGTPGLRLGPPLRPIGWTAAGVGDVTFDGCLVRNAMLGAPGKGLSLVLRALTQGRLAIAAIGAGLAQGAWERCLARARGRVSANGRLLDHEAVRRMLVDMWVRAAAARLFALDAAAALDAGRDVRTEAAMAKLVATEAAVDNAKSAVQIFGAAGTRPGEPVARLWGDAKVLEIVEGTSEIQRLVLGRALERASPEAPTEAVPVAGRGAARGGPGRAEAVPPGSTPGT